MPDKGKRSFQKGRSKEVAFALDDGQGSEPPSANAKMGTHKEAN